jgi:hypothetical protein
MVGMQQSDFVRGRTPHGNFMMVQGMARKLHNSSTQAVLLKLDITKAFDSVDWAFLVDVLRNLGFGERILAVICALLSTASTRVLLNGIPGSRIANMCGLRQGDPLSLQLFILIMEVLHLMIEKAGSVGLLTPLAASGLRCRTSMYDDVVTFLRPTRTDFRVFAAVVEDLQQRQVSVPTWTSVLPTSFDALMLTGSSLTRSCNARWSPSPCGTWAFPSH